MTKTIPLLTLAALAALVTPSAQAQAQAAPPAEAAPLPLTANISVVTNYKFRGQDQGNGKYLAPAVQGGFDFTKYGFYLGNWNSNVSFNNTSLEMDFYGGYKGEITPDIAYDVGVLQYYYPQNHRRFNGAADYNTTELYAAVSYGPATLKYSHTVSKDYFGLGHVGADDVYSGRNTGYLDLSANFPLVENLTLNTHVGYTRYSSELRNDVGVPSYYDLKLGVTYDLSKYAGSGVTVAAAVIGANKRDFYGDINKYRFVAALGKSF